MKLFNNKLIKSGLIFGCCIFVSFLIELFCFNFKTFTLDKSIRGIKSIEYVESIVEDKKIIKLDLDNIYINKLKIDYKTDEDIEYIIQYVEKNYYNGTNEKEIKDRFDNEVGQQVTNLKNEITEISIIYDLENEIDISGISIDNRLHFNYFRFIFIGIVIIAFYFICKYYKNDGKLVDIHKYFVLLGILLGSTMIILQPSATYYSWDDQIHFSNMYQLSGGKLIWTIGEASMIDVLPVGRDSIHSYEDQKQQKLYLSKEEMSDYYTDDGRFIPYNKIAYIPSSLGYCIFKALNFPFDICFKIGKFMNLLVYLFIFGYAIKISKIGKRLLLVLGLIPTSLFLACQYSYDPAVISGFILAIVCLLNWFVDKNEKVNFKNLLIFILSMLYSCSSKAIYIPFILLFLFISKDKFKNKKQAILVKCGIIAICFLIMSTFIFPVVSGGAITGDSRGGDTSVSGQLQVILENPIGYVNVLNDTMVENFFDSFVGNGALGSYAYLGNISTNIYMIFFILMLFVTFVDNSKIEFKMIYKILLFICVLGVTLLIWTAMYLSFTPIGLNTINGVQPRYFLPLLFPLLICFNFGRINFKGSDKIYNFAILFILYFVNFVSIYQLILSRYCL